MSSKDGSLPAGWAVSVTRDLDDIQGPEKLIYAARICNPMEAEALVRAYLNAPVEREVRAVAILKLETLERLAVAPNEATGPI